VVSTAVHLWLAATVPTGRWPVAADDTDLDDHERATAGRFVTDHDRLRYLAAHRFLRQVLAWHTALDPARLQLLRTRRGRPTLDLRRIPYRPTGGRLDFNLSHTRDTVVVGVVAGRRIGVDVEQLGGPGPGPTTLAEVAAGYTARERSWLAALARDQRHRGALRLWTLKEAYAKARGLGLALPFDSFGFGFDQRGRLRTWYPPADDVAARWRFLELEPEAGLLLAVAVTAGTGPPGPVRLHYGCPPQARRTAVPVVVDGTWGGCRSTRTLTDTGSANPPGTRGRKH
jgi:4'-phosphopantetheinyl transferase